MSSTYKVSGDIITVTIDTKKLKKLSYETKKGEQREMQIAGKIGDFSGEEIEVGGKRFNLKLFCSLAENKPKKAKETF